MIPQPILDLLQHYLAGFHVDEHTLLIFAIGVIVGMMLTRGGGVHRRAYSAYRRLRPW